MILLIIICLLTIVGIIASIIFFPELTFKKIRLDTFWVISLIGALLIISFGLIDYSLVWSNLTSESEINPIKILFLFLSMALLSIYLDELGFFKKLAIWAHERAKANQIAIFLSFYFVISLLTIFTSNDIIILTFTPFIINFAKKAKINPLPYLISEFIAANTWSNMLIIGNPTNIYLATSFNVNFIDYFKIMFFPTIISGFVSLGLSLLLFRKELKKPIKKENSEKIIIGRGLLIIGLIHLFGCTGLLTVASYLKLPMWLISFGFALSLIITTFIYQILKKDKTKIINKALKRLPWNLVPFVLSMFIIVLSLNTYHITHALNKVLNDNPYFYGFSAFFLANILNNIPMSVMFAEILKGSSNINLVLFPTIIASNIGAYLTPIGALAGIMWMNILKKEEVKLSFLSFTKKTAFIALITMAVSLTIFLKII